MRLDTLALSLRRLAIDAVIRAGGKQYRVHEGSVLDVATMSAEPGSRVELRDVLLLADGDKITVGQPTVADAVVVAEVIEHGKGRKVINFKYKAKTRYRRKRGHRQGFTKLSVREIRIGDAPPAAEEGPARRRRPASAEAPVEEPETPLIEPEAVSTESQAAALEATPPRRRRRTTSEEQTQE